MSGAGLNYGRRSGQSKRLIGIIGRALIGSTFGVAAFFKK